MCGRGTRLININCLFPHFLSHWVQKLALVRSQTFQPVPRSSHHPDSDCLHWLEYARTGWWEGLGTKLAIYAKSKKLDSKKKAWEHVNEAKCTTVLLQSQPSCFTDDMPPIVLLLATNGSATHHVNNINWAIYKIVCTVLPSLKRHL